MKSQILGLRVASMLFGLIGLGHVLRIVLDIRIVVGDVYLQRRWNAVAAVILAALCVWLWRLSTKGSQAA